MLPEETGECFAFASFRLYPKQRTLMREKDVVSIGGRAFDVLYFLVTRAGDVVSLGELMAFVWPSVTVEEANLRVQMGMLRKILGQCPNAARAIETVPLRGYCFILPVQHRPDGAEGARQQSKMLAPLPILVNPPIGRDDTIEILIEVLEERRLVTVTGAGGIGKTTVALATAIRFADGYSAQIHFVDLSCVQTHDELVSALADALDPGTMGADLQTLLARLDDRQATIILDTCEHIVDAVATLVEALLAHCDGLKFLVTSREPLRAMGEWTLRLSPLRYPREDEALNVENIGEFPAVALFVDRVSSSMRFAVAAPDMPFLAEICRRLDGIPLALEFAAARVADLGLREIAAHLDDRFEILTRGRRTALPRHRTLSAVFDWSYGLLADEEQAMLLQLARTGGPFSADDAIAIGDRGGCAQPAEALAGLYEKSLLAVDTRDEAPVYRLLDTTRAYVNSRSHAADPLQEPAALHVVRIAQA